MTRFSSFRLLGSLVSLFGLSGFALLGGACSSTGAGTSAGADDEHLGSADSALTAAQCSYFDVNGKDQICHHTSSAAHPYTIIKTNLQGCINGHAGHAGDYITSTDPSSPTYDPTCKGGGCLPVNAPCDATLPCCEGSTCTNGVCVGTPPDPCAGVTCVAIDQCHAAGTCNSVTGACSSPTVANGTACNDGSACTSTDTCSAGTCSGSGNPCQNGASCSSNAGNYTCSCPPGFTGANCETAVNLCAEPCPLPAWADDECTVAPCNPATGVCGDLDFYAHLHELCNGNTGACSGGVCHDLPPTCDSVPCANGGTCSPDYYCACPAGWAGTHCEIDITGVDDCADGPCVNGGTCIDGLGSYTCSCSGGFTGTWCEIPPAAPSCPCSGDPTWEENLTGVPTQFYQDATYATGAYVIGDVYRTTDVYKNTGVCLAKKYEGSTLVASVEHGSLSAAEANACFNIVSTWISSVP